MSLLVSWNIDPVMVRFGWLAISWYGLFFAGGFLTGLQIVQWIYRREQRDPSELDALLWWILGGTIIGMRLVHCFIYEPEYYFSHLSEIPQIWRGGYASHGGVAGLLLAVFFFCRKPGRPNYLWLLDRLAIPGVLAGAFIRIGNFFNSEIYGIPTQGNYGVIFERVDLTPRHPVQLYEAAAYVAIFVILLSVYRRSSLRRDGLICGLFFILVFAARFMLEFLKTPQAAYESGFTIHVGQYLSLPFILLGIILVARARPVKVGSAQTSE